MLEENCPFCKPKKKDWEEDGFYGYRCKDCQGSTAFVVSTEHRSTKLTDKEKETVKNLCEKHYPNLKIKWLSEKRTKMNHFYDFLVPTK